MEYSKTKKDEQQEERDLRSNPTLLFLKHKEEFKFSPGDVLIKLHPRWNRETEKYDWVPEVVSNVSSTPRKYLYVFENELGIGYVRQFKADGKGLGNSLQCMANFSPDNTRFQLDPEYADHLLLSEEGEKFDHNKAYKEKRKYRLQQINKNKKIVVNTSDLASMIAFLRSLKVGDEFWYGRDVDSMTTSKYRVKQIHEEEIAKLHHWDKQRLSQYYPDQTILQGVVRKITLEVLAHKWKSIGGTEQLTEEHGYRDMYISLVPPFKLTDDL